MICYLSIVLHKQRISVDDKLLLYVGYSVDIGKFKLCFLPSVGSLNHSDCTMFTNDTVIFVINGVILELAFGNRSVITHIFLHTFEYDVITAVAREVGFL